MKKGFFKKLGLVVTTVAVAVTSVFALTACNNNDPVLDTSDDIKMIDVELTSESYAYLVRKGNTEMKNTINNLLTTKAKEIEAIKNKYLLADTETLETFGMEVSTAKDPAKADKQFVVATSADFPPFEYKNGKKYAGIDIEIAKLFADELGQELVLVDYTGYFESTMTSLGDEANPTDVDVAMAGLSYDEDRAKIYDYCEDYFNTGIVVLTKKDNTLFDGITTVDALNEKLNSLTGDQAKCGGQTGTTSDTLINTNYKNLKFSKLDDAGKAVVEMNNGGIEFVVVDKATAKALMNKFNNN